MAEHARKRLAPVLRLVPRMAPRAMTPKGEDTAYLLDQVHRMVRSGDVNGVALIAIKSDGHYFVDAAGQAYADPTFARGAIAMLSDELGKLARGEAWEGA